MIFYCIRPIDGFYVASADGLIRVVSVTDDAFGRSLSPVRYHSFENLLGQRIDHNVDVFPFPPEVFFAPFEEAADAGESIGSYYFDADIYQHLINRPAKILGNKLKLVHFLRDKLATKNAIAKLGISIPTLRPLPDGKLGGDPVVLRPSTSDGGSGIRLSSHVTPTEARRFSYAEEYVDGPSFNVHFTIGPDRIRVYAPSVQLIGIDVLAPEPFAYCGGDFFAAQHEDRSGHVMEKLMVSTARIAKWLAEAGYRGAGGVDFIVRDGTEYFLEINPRMQCSSFALSIALAEDEKPTIDQLHCAAFLEEEVVPLDLVEFVTTTRTPPSHLVLVHDGKSGILNAILQEGEYNDNLFFIRPFDTKTPRRLLHAKSDVWLCGTPIEGTFVHRGAQLGRIVISQSVLDSNSMQMKTEWRQVVHQLRKSITVSTET